MSDTSISNWEPVDADEAASLIGEGVHVGLRKGSDADSAHGLWQTISESKDGAWGDALSYMVEGLESMGYRLCAAVPVEDVTSGDENTGG